MSVWTWILIPLVAIIGGFIIEYQKNKMSMIDLGRQNEEEVEALQELVYSLKERVENLEAIAANDPNEFSGAAGNKSEKGRIDFDTAAEENKREISEQADKRRKRQ